MFVLLTLLLTRVALASAPLSVDYLEDPAHSMSLEQVQSSTRWKATTGREINFGYSDSKFWFRFHLSSGTLPEGPFALEVPFVGLDRLELNGPGGYRGVTGLMVPLSLRPTLTGSFVFPLRLKPDEETFYLTAQSAMPLRIPLKLRSQEQFQREELDYRLVVGAFAGIMAFAFLFSMIAGLALKSRVIRNYSFFVLGILLMSLSNEGLLTRYFFPEWPWWTRRELHLLGAFTIFAYAQFVRGFLETRRFKPVLDKILLVLVGFSTLRGFWFLFQFNRVISMLVEYDIVLINLLTITMALLLLRKSRPARYFILGAMGFNLSFALYILHTVGTISLSPKIDYAPYFGTVFDAMMLGAGLIAVMREKFQSFTEQKLAVARGEKLRALGQMAAGIAHEINNPLAIIHAYAQNMKKKGTEGNIEGDQVAVMAEKIESTSMRISKIIKSMRSFAHDSESEPFSDVSVAGILEDTLDLCRERLLANGIGLEISVIPSELTIRCRSVEVSQVFLNLLNNSLDAIEKLPEKWIELSARNGEGRIEIAITDSGSGISQSIQARIFEPFFTTKQQGRGTGLGLSISRSIAESHGGKLRYDSASPNTRFVLTLPAQ
ncbi:MAG: 7TM diverse intracellular signaling domain-containing protein [Bdellovibrionota bacterium]